MTELTKVTRGQLPRIRKELLDKQGGRCLLCWEPINLSAPREAVVDHDHNTGEIRGVLHSWCNGAEGKAYNAIARWGKCGNNPEAVRRFMVSLVNYYRQHEVAGSGLMYPSHKTDEEKRLARNAKARKQRAEAKARATLRGK